MDSVIIDGVVLTRAQIEKAAAKLKEQDDNRRHPGDLLKTSTKLVLVVDSLATVAAWVNRRVGEGQKGVVVTDGQGELGIANATHGVPGGYTHVGRGGVVFVPKEPVA